MAEERPSEGAGPGLVDLAWRPMIRAERLRADLTQQELAVRAGVSVETIRKYEAGVRTPSRDRLLQLLASMQVPPSRSAAVLSAAGYAPPPGVSRRNPAGSPAFSLSAAATTIEISPWPRLILDETLELVGANHAAQALLGLDPGFEHDGRTPASLNLLAILADPKTARRVVNLDACVTAVVASLKAALGRVLQPADAAALADEILAECTTRNPAAARRLLHAWDVTPPARSARGTGFQVVWRGENNIQVRFLAATSTIDGSNGYIYADLHPADAASHANLEHLLRDAPLRTGPKRRQPMRHSSPT
jgi:transcriptional regulator with XRE-family HTH domain